MEATTAEELHRLKTSLAVIAGWASTLDDRWEELPDERRREGVGIIRRASAEMAEQTRRLLDDARAELLPLDREPVRLDLCEVLDVTTEALDGISREHAVVHVTAGGVAPIDVDPAALQQVLGHLVENAVKYSPPGGSVRLSAEVRGGDVVLEVADDGPGVPPDIDVFAPFARGVGDEVPGTGLGLHIVRSLVLAMGGQVEADGATFRVRLPAAR